MWKSILLGAALLAAPALASGASDYRGDFEAYAGADAIRTGHGGRKVTAHGIDFWTKGDPGARYRIVGHFRDVRSDEARVADVVGDPSIAKAALARGADALVVVRRKQTLARTGRAQPWASEQQRLSDGPVAAVYTTTWLMAVEYLP